MVDSCACYIGARAWSISLSRVEKLDDRMRVVLIVTHSRRGFTDNMAKAVADGVEEVPNVKAVVKRVNEVESSDLAEADALAIGSPIYLDCISGELKHLLENTYYKFGKAEKINKLKWKPAAAFVCGRYKGYLIRKLQFKSVVLKKLERILFSYLEMSKVVNGIHLIHDISVRDPRAPLPLTREQAALCKNFGRKLASEVVMPREQN